MPREKSLSEFRKEQTVALREKGMIPPNYARRLRRSPNIVSSCLKSPETYNAKMQSGRSPKLSAKNKRRVIRKISKGGKSCLQVKDELGLDVPKTTISRKIKRHGTFQCKKRQCVPFMIFAHKPAAYSGRWSMPTGEASGPVLFSLMRKI